MILRPPRSTRTDTLFPYTTLFRSSGGVRLNRTLLEADNLVFPTYIGPIDPSNGGGFGIDLKFQNDFTRLASQKATTTDWLPRILFNYRQSDNLTFRGGYFLSVVRPTGRASSRERMCQ